MVTIEPSKECRSCGKKCYGTQCRKCYTKRGTKLNERYRARKKYQERKKEELKGD